jgi:hypothetical protein
MVFTFSNRRDAERAENGFVVFNNKISVLCAFCVSAV